VISASLESGSANVFQLLEAGAMDVYPKPRAVLDVDLEKLGKELASKIRIVAGVQVLSHPHFKTSTSTALQQAPQLLSSHPDLRIIVMGASTGGPKALHEILSHLPADFPLPILCVQHISNGFLSDFVTWLNESSPLSVCLAVQNTTPQAGVVYFAPENRHLELDKNGRLILSELPACDGHRPSITVAMRAAAAHFGASTVGVLLTGMGSDGAAGMMDIAAAGGITLAQDEASCVVYGMPKVAVALGAVQHTLALGKIAPALISLANEGKRTAIGYPR
jgi:two-component system chemotaxis response regulator CheB